MSPCPWPRWPPGGWVAKSRRSGGGGIRGSEGGQAGPPPLPAGEAPAIITHHRGNRTSGGHRHNCCRPSDDGQRDVPPAHEAHQSGLHLCRSGPDHRGAHPPDAALFVPWLVPEWSQCAARIFVRLSLACRAGCVKVAWNDCQGAQG